MYRCLGWGVLGALMLPVLAWANEPIPVTSVASQPSVVPAVADHATLEKTVAGSVVGAIAERFGGRPVEVKFGALDEQMLDGRQRSIQGEGNLRFAGESGWIGFRFQSLYDAFLGQPGLPQLEIGVGSDARPIPNDSRALQHLEDHMADILQRELGLASARMQLDRVETIETGLHYLGIEARGLADFGREGSSDIRIRALYDRRNGQWLELDYDLSPDAPVMQAAVAGR